MNASTLVLVASLLINIFLVVLGVPGSVVCTLDALMPDSAKEAAAAMHVRSI